MWNDGANRKGKAEQHAIENRLMQANCVQDRDNGDEMMLQRGHTAILCASTPW